MMAAIGKLNRRDLAYAAGGFAAAVVLWAVFAPYLRSSRHQLEILAVTGATPLAVREEVRRGVSLEVRGATARTYRFDHRALNAFAPIHRRTLEVSPVGAFEGSYRYTGIPVLHILEGVAPRKTEESAFDRPLDLIVTFIAASGDQKHFSYGELTMTDDSDAVMLAFARSPVLPTKLGADEPYPWKLHREPLRGLRLVCPAEPTTARYLDEVVMITLVEPTVENANLPVSRRGERCIAESITVVRGDHAAPLTLAGVAAAAATDWVRHGHGRGFKAISTAQGYELRSLLHHNFPGAGRDDFYLFVACDGYRAIFSGHEIFATEAGRRMMLVEIVDGEPLPGGASVGPVKDYFVDRVVRAVTHIVLIDAIR
jgi:hypothetical protein